MYKTTIAARVILALVLVLGVIHSLAAASQGQSIINNGSAEQDTRVITVSGTTVTFLDAIRAQSNNFEMLVTGAPATASVSISGCMKGGTCTVLVTSTSTASTILSTSGAGPFDSYKVTASWTGGASPTFTFNWTATVAKEQFQGGLAGAPVVAVNQGQATTQPIYLATAGLPGTDRAAVAKALWTNGLPGNNVHAFAINMQGECLNATSKGTTNWFSNPYPVTSTYGGTDQNYGPSFYIQPCGVVLDTPTQIGGDNILLFGEGPGSTFGGVVQGSMMFPDANFLNNIGTGTSYCPGLLNFGLCAGNLGNVVAGTGPYGDSFGGFTLDADNYTSGSAVISPGVIPLVYGTGQDSNYISNMTLQNSLAVNLEMGGGTDGGYSAGNGQISGLFIKHGDPNTCTSTTLSGITGWAIQNPSGSHYVVVVTYTDSPTTPPEPGMSITLSGLAAGGTHATNVNRPASGAIPEYAEIVAVPGAGLVAQNLDFRSAGVTFSSAKQFAYMVNAGNTDTGGAGGTATYGATDARWNTNFGGKILGPWSASAAACVAATVPGKVGIDISGLSIHTQDIHAESHKTAIQDGAERCPSGQVWLNPNPSSQTDDAFVLSNHWCTPTDIVISDLVGSATTSGGGAGANYTFEDMQWGNRLTNTNNKVIPLIIVDHSGFPFFFSHPVLATPEISNAWYEDAGSLQLVKSGVALAGFDNTAADTVCVGCTDSARQTSNITLSTAGTFSAMCRQYTLPAGHNYAVHVAGAYQVGTALAAMTLEFTNSGTTTNAAIAATVYGAANAAPLIQFLNNSATPITGPTVAVLNTPYLFRMDGTIEIGGTGSVQFSLKWSTGTTGDGVTMIRDTTCSVEEEIN